VDLPFPVYPRRLILHHLYRHNPLVGALARVSDLWMACQCRHLAYMAEFAVDIQHVAGQDNVAADAVSRPPITAPSSLSSVVADLRGIAAHQFSCPSTLHASKSPSLQVETCEVEGAPWYTSHIEKDLYMFRLAWYAGNHCCLVQRLCGLSTGQGNQAAWSLCSSHTHSTTKV
jgi:hypothetical protein